MNSKLKRLDYQIILEWSDEHHAYRAFVPTLLEYVVNFVPHCTAVGMGVTPSSAISAAVNRAHNVIDELKILAILPPPPDTTSSFDDVRSPFDFENERKYQQML